MCVCEREDEIDVDRYHRADAAAVVVLYHRRLEYMAWIMYLSIPSHQYHPSYSSSTISSSLLLTYRKLTSVKSSSLTSESASSFLPSSSVMLFRFSSKESSGLPPSLT